MVQRRRGASLVEYLVLVAVVLGVAAAGFVAYSRHVDKSAQGQGVCVEKMGGDCSKQGALGAIAANGPVAATDGRARAGEMVCTREGCTGGRCFAAGTMVRTKTGMRAIETLKQGEGVLASSEESLEASEFGIEKVVVSQDREIMELTVERDGESETFRVTPEHAFYIEGREWVKTSELAVGDVLRTEAGSLARVSRLVRNGERTTVYNLEVATHHTYYVGKSNVLSRSACERVPPTDAVRNRAKRGELWETSRFNAVHRLAGCKDLEPSDYAILADAVRGEADAKRAYLSSKDLLGQSPEAQAQVREAAERPWFDRALQAIRAGVAEGRPGAAEALASTGAK